MRLPYGATQDLGFETCLGESCSSSHTVRYGSSGHGVIPLLERSDLVDKKVLAEVDEESCFSVREQRIVQPWSDLPLKSILKHGPSTGLGNSRRRAGQVFKDECWIQANCSAKTKINFSDVSDFCTRRSCIFIAIVFGFPVDPTQYLRLNATLG